MGASTTTTSDASAGHADPSALPLTGTVPFRALTSAILAMLVWAGLASNASALILTGGPVYSLPGGGSCSVAGIASQAGGATLSCTGVNLSAHTHVYFGIRNSTNVIGNTMTGSAPTAGSGAVFRYASSTGSSITYTSATTITDVFNGTLAVSNQLVLTVTGGSASVVATGGTPSSNSFGDIERIFQVNSGSFSIRADVKASDADHGLGYACPAVFDPTPQPASDSDISKVDVAFYYSDCGDGQIDSPEQCDLGAGNGNPGTCCQSNCTFRANGSVCRPGVDSDCDTSETCTGAAATCPPDDAPINNGKVCRPGSGDVCDQNETCTGIPGQACPPDDAPGNTSIICRPSSVAGAFCDEPEYCTGLPGATCPPNDAPAKVNMVCRPGSGDICDPDERCTGIPGQGCPADVVSNPTTLCRTGSGDMCDPNEYCTGVPGAACPANVVQPSSTVCRSATGVCDVAENCTGVAGQTCPPNGFAPSSTPCDYDNNVCTIDHCDGNGACTLASTMLCDDGIACTQDTCDPQNGCVYTGEPSTTCRTPVKASLDVKDNVVDSRDLLKFIWKGGPVLFSELGDPTATTRYELCVYDTTGIRLAVGVPPGFTPPFGPGWRLLGTTTSPKGYRYKDASADILGIKDIKLQASSVDRATLKLIAKGIQMPDNPPPPYQLPLKAQLYSSDGTCWEAAFAPDTPQVRLNGPGIFKGKLP